MSASAEEMSVAQKLRYWADLVEKSERGEIPMILTEDVGKSWVKIEINLENGSDLTNIAAQRASPKADAL